MTDRKEYLREYRVKNKQRIKFLQARYYEENKEKLKNYFKEYYIKTRNKRRELGKKHYEENKSLYLAYSRTRKAIIRKACPDWLSEEQYEEIKAIYSRCRDISEETGIFHHVDHIVPLAGKTVCGLHVPWNLQIITA